MILNILFGFGFLGTALIAFMAFRDNRKLARQNSMLHDGLRQSAAMREGMTRQIEVLKMDLERTRSELRRRKELEAMLARADANTSMAAAIASRSQGSQLLDTPKPHRVQEHKRPLHIGGFAVTQLDSSFPVTEINEAGFAPTAVSAGKRT